MRVKFSGKIFLLVVNLGLGKMEKLNNERENMILSTPGDRAEKVRGTIASSYEHRDGIVRNIICLDPYTPKGDNGIKTYRYDRNFE